eukprot:gene19946-23864_t
MKAGNVRKFGERSPQQVGQEEKSSRHMEHERGSADQANTEEFIKEIREQAAKRTDAYPGGATMPDLCDTHGEDMKKLTEAAGAAEADMTALEAVAEYMATVYEDARKVKYQRGFPLETIYGLPAGHGKTHYQLVVNCTDLTPEEQDEVGNAERQLHIISEQLRGHTTKDLEKQLRSMPSVESAIKGARGLPAYMEKHTNSIRLVAVTEEAADNIESKVLAFPGLGEYTVQRIRPSLTNRGEDETEVIVVDKGSTINLA